MPSKVYSAAIVGLDAQIIEVEAEVSFGLRNFEIVGLPDKAVEESKERISAAIKSSSLKSPGHQPWRTLINLAPADLKKEGSFYDLPIAMAFLVASNQLRFNPEEKIFIGELALDGRLRPVRGVLSFVLLAKNKGIREIILPKENIPEASLISLLGQKDLAPAQNLSFDKPKLIGAENLKEVVAYLENRKEIQSPQIRFEDYIQEPEYPVDLGWVKGQEYAKRALEISAAGSHHLLMQGPPGAGKSLLAKALPSILPPLSPEEILEITKIYSIAGFLPKEKPLINFRPFRSPHHSVSEVALIGGGNPPRPGEITLAHRGVLFLDEFPEFHRDVLESLRQPIEEGEITILRSRHSLRLPANFTLLAAANPCPCGYLNDPEKNCQCQSSQIQKYRRKLSGPLMDRVDLFIGVPQLKYEKLIASDPEHSSAKIRRKIEKARQVQKERFLNDDLAKIKILTNSEMNLPQIKKYCQVELKSENLLRKAVDSGQLSARGYHRVLKVARTIADLENSEKILPEHLAESLMYRLREANN